MLMFIAVMGLAAAAFALGGQVERTRLDLFWRRKLATLKRELSAPQQED